MSESSKSILNKVFNHQEVNRVPVSFYELDGLSFQGNNMDDFNIYRDESWRDLLDLTRQNVDLIYNVGNPAILDANGNTITIVPSSLIENSIKKSPERYEYNTIINYGATTLKSRSFRVRDIDTIWNTEHLLHDEKELKSWIDLPTSPRSGKLSNTERIRILEIQEKIGDRGIIMLDTIDPLGYVASLFSMEDFTVMAMTEADLFTKAVEKAFEFLAWQLEMVCKEFPEQLWRIYGPEYATEPFLPPTYFERYVAQYDAKLIDIIHATGGKARLHSHGKIKNNLSTIVAMNVDAIEPLEPPIQGDMTLAEVRKVTGDQITLMGNLEITDIENLPHDEFRKKVRNTIDSIDWHKNFILMPSASPYGRQLSTHTLDNYRIIVEEVNRA